MSNTSKPPHPLALIILDGVALNPNPEANAVELAQTPCLDGLLAGAPNTTLCSFGERVGLPPGQMGNSEVGHLNIGAGRVVEQLLARIDRLADEGSLAENPAMRELCRAVAGRAGTALHMIGLISNGGVHSQAAHFKALLSAALELGVTRIIVHAITDGRDCAPNAAIDEINGIENFVSALNTKYRGHASVTIATLIGRYYAMDRDNRWERTQRAYDLITRGIGAAFPNAKTALAESYAENVSDEFIKPVVLAEAAGGRSPWISDGDAVLFFNFRADRMRQIVKALFEPGNVFTHFERVAAPRCSMLASLAQYDDDFPLRVLFPPQTVANHLGEVLSQAGLRQLRAAETEKYPHVTYFFNGGIEDPYPGEDRILVPSRRDVPTYDLAPEMSAPELTEKLLAELRRGAYDVYIINFANGDMVGHTGNLPAAIAAVETVDSCLSRLLQVIEELGGAALVTADHGNADQMLDYNTGEKHTFHTKHPVPLILFGRGVQNKRLRPGGALCDIAPTILELLQLAQPSQMTGQSLLEPEGHAR